MKRSREKSVRRQTMRAVISSIAPTGEGVTHVDFQSERRAIFVRASAIHDELEMAVDFSKRPARARILQVLNAGPSRLVPACIVADRCGGCDYMHLTHNGQLEAHQAHVRAALPSNTPTDFPIAVIPADHTERYRARARLHVRVSGGRANVGFYETDSHDIVATDSCLVLHETLDAARGHVASLLEGAVGEGEAFLALGKPESIRKPTVSIVWPRDLPAAAYARAERAVADGTWQGIRILCGDSARASVIGDPSPWIVGADGSPLELAPGGFAQASESMNGKLAHAVFEAARQSSPSKIVELFAGAGNFTILLATVGAHVTAVEQDASACEAAQRNLAQRHLKATVVVADASSFVVAPKTEVVVLDPPRTGAHKISESLARNPVRRVIYVSCDTRTLARDLTILSSTYAIESVTTFEMFPHTSHTETLVVLSKKQR